MKGKWFRRGWLVFLKYGLVLLIVVGIAWGISFAILYKEVNWVAISALTTLVLAFAAFLAIQQTRETQKRERRDRLLNEIIEWAIDVAKCEYSVFIEEPSLIFTKLYDKDVRAYDIKDKEKLVEGIMQDHRRAWQSRYMNLHRNYQTLDARGEHILSLSTTKDFKSIYNTISMVKTQISGYQDTLWEYMKDIDEKLKKEELENKAKELNTSAVKLIKEATKIQTKDIS